MTTEDFIIGLFCEVDDRMAQVPRHPQAKLWPRESVTIGILFAFKGGYFRAFYRWLRRDYGELFGEMPERTRLQRLLQTHQDDCTRFLADATFFSVIDSYGIELIHPIREGRSKQQIGKKGKSNWRWIVGLKLCWLIDGRGRSSLGLGRRRMFMTRCSCRWSRLSMAVVLSWPMWVSDMQKVSLPTSNCVGGEHGMSACWSKRLFRWSRRSVT